MHQDYYKKCLYIITVILIIINTTYTSADTNQNSQQSNDDPKIPAEQSEVSQDVANNEINEADDDSKTIDETKSFDSQSTTVTDKSAQLSNTIVAEYKTDSDQIPSEVNTNGDTQDEDLRVLKSSDEHSSKLNEFETNPEELDDDTEQAADEVSLTPEMELANEIYHQAMKLINVTSNRQYEAAYKLLQKAADLGHIGAKEELAFGHIMGIYIPMNLKLAREYFEEGIKVGSPQSHYGLYFMHSIGIIPNTSIAKALVHLTFAASDGHHLAQMALGYRYWRSINIHENCESALTFYQKAATYVVSKTTSASGIVQRIRLYDEEENAIPNNILFDHHLLQYYQLLADRGDPQAQYGIGQLFYYRDSAYDKALHYFRLAAENGNSNALAYLGKLYAEKNSYIKQNNQTAVQFFQAAVERGNPIGQAGLGLAYYHGAGVEKSYQKAFRLFQLSAEQSYSEGQFMLGVMYYNGQNVKRDLKLALKWFQAASQSGHVLGHYNLAQMYASGTGVLRSCSTAVEFLKSVAERGAWLNMFTKAFQLYKQGHIEQAFMMYLYLAELGYEVAQSNVAYIIDQMPFDISTIYKTQEERYRKALVYWHRAAIQGFHYARIKLGDYYYYGYGTEQSYELAASQYKHASEQSRNSQAMFNLAYMHEKGLGLKRDIHLAKRFYDMALATNQDAYLPVFIVLFKLQFVMFVEKFFSIFVSFTNHNSSATENNRSAPVESDSSWDLYLMTGLVGLICFLYALRRQRLAVR